MRYFIIKYLRKASGKIDESTQVTKNIKLKDRQTANVILDFKTQTVLQCVIDGQAMPKDWDRLVSYYYQHYPSTMERLFKDNGHEIKVEESQATDPS
jgi:hypothetical protein